ncbi:MAG: exodeoxyribonuclease VII large subunit [Dehalococcoidia bacterium]|nr:exodeoxyribonuclease VII large subunit [Dehalococcoidia bacterium]
MEVYSVSRITTYLRELLETDPHLADIWVSGEVSNLTRSTAGHLYFTLKDADSQLRCVFFRGATLQRDLASIVESRAQVVAHGRISLYEVRGDLQFYVDFVQPEGVGELAMEFERLKARLEQDGLFEQTRKRRVPPFPERIGVVTSPTGAVFHDICAILARRWPLAEIVLAPSAVQGTEAVRGIVAGIAALNDEPDMDVIIVARGGGSMEELWAFNEEAVARAIYASHAPVVSAVGHETDYTIADYVADVRAPTPSTAAELVAPDRRTVATTIVARRAALSTAVRLCLDEGVACLRGALGRMEHCAPPIDRDRQRVDDVLRLAGTMIDAAFARSREHVGGFLLQLRSLHPQATLARGYALVEKDGSAVRSVREVKSGDALDVRVSDGAFPARVEPKSSARRRGSRPSQETQPPLFTSDGA